MRGILFILVLFALLVGSYLVFKNISEQTSDEDGSTQIQAIEKARRGAETLEKIQEEINKRAKEAAE